MSEKLVSKKETKQRRFHHWVKCSKCGRSMCRDRTLADCWLILFYGDKNCEHPHDFKRVTKKEASVYV